jgi:hypothetical protein
MRRSLAIGLLWFLAAAAADATPWSSNCIQPLLIGQTVGGGQLTTSDCYWYYPSSPGNHYYTDIYSFTGTAGQQISVALSSTAFDTVVELLDVNEITASPLAADDNGGGGTNSRIPAGSGTFSLPRTGTYYVWVESVVPNATGAYTLALNGAASAYARTYVQKAYVSYYGRPADPAGLAYWAARMDAEGGSLNAIIAAFGYSEEFNRRYGGLSYTALVTKIYQQTLARNPDPAGLAYYVGELQAGRRILQSITLDVLNGATTAPDSTTVANKLEVADYFTAKVAAGCDYGGEQAGLDALSPVTHLPATVTAAKATTDNRCAGGGGADSDDTQLAFDGVAPAPPMSIVPERPMSGRNVKVTVTAPGALSISVLVTGGGCGTLTGRTEPTSVVLLTGTAADNGYCDLTATASYAGGVTRILAGNFEVQASNPDLPPVTPDGGVYVLRPFPAASSGGTAPTITAIDGPPGFVNGGTATYSIRYNGVQPISSALMRVPGYEGYYRVPATSSNGTATVNLRFAPDYFAATPQLAQQRAAMIQAAAAGPLNLQFSLEDILGAISGAFSLNLNPAQVTMGDVKVSIAWDTPTDVDLWVKEPSGTWIYYGQPTSASGGHLDLDSNAGCQLDNVNNENIYWPSGQSPNGAFEVKVHMYESGCGTPPGPAGASGTVTMTYCGSDSPKIVPFSLPGEDATQTFTFTSLCGSRVSGKVKFEDFPVTDAGLGASAMVPVRYAKVQVVRSNGIPEEDFIMADGSTDAAGKYDITFVNDKPAIPGFYVRVLAQQNSTSLKQVVQNLNGDIYAFRTPKENEPLIDGSKPPADQQGFKVDMEVKKADGAGALNIFDVGVDASLYAWSRLGTTPSLITFRWTTGVGSGSSYSKATDVIKVGGSAANGDEYDDVVIAHEYGHFVMQKYSVSDSPGGPHSSNDRVTPPLAWGEGWATFFALSSQKRTSYADTNSTGMQVFYDIETLPASKPLGNQDNVLAGSLSEAVVAGVLLDLFDASNETNDTLSDKSTAIWRVFTTYLANGFAKFADRGAAGRDLVDFLDGWFCLGYGDKGADDAKGVRGIVKTLHVLSYDFADVASCK